LNKVAEKRVFSGLHSCRLRQHVTKPVPQAKCCENGLLGALNLTVREY
jgi:hypothetical protein